MATTKRGPRTPEGKTKAAKNSTKHGLRSENLSSTEQINEQSNFLQELIDHYKPVGPLEKMQLERIATCRVKLKSLYDLEHAKLDLLLESIRSDLRKNISELSYLEPVERGMLYELMVYGELLLPLNLNYELLEKIVNEIDRVSIDISSDDDLKDCFPNLTAYLMSINANDSELHLKLMSVSQQLQSEIDHGESYSVVGQLVFDKLTSKSKKKVKELTPEEIAHEKAFAEHMEAAAERRRIQYGIKEPKKNEIVFPPKKKIMEALDVFKTLLNAYQATLINQHTIQERIKMKELTVSLPIEEADLLMRYQTSWERRLSTLMGEFMRMQEMRIERESAQALLLKQKPRS